MKLLRKLKVYMSVITTKKDDVRRMLEVRNCMLTHNKGNKF